MLVAFLGDDNSQDEAPGTEPTAETTLRCELKAGDMVVTSPLPKAVEGMPITLRTRELANAPRDRSDREMLAEANSPLVGADLRTLSGVQ